MVRTIFTFYICCFYAFIGVDFANYDSHYRESVAPNALRMMMIRAVLLIITFATVIKNVFQVRYTSSFITSLPTFSAGVFVRGPRYENTCGGGSYTALINAFVEISYMRVSRLPLSIAYYFWLCCISDTSARTQIFQNATSSSWSYVAYHCCHVSSACNWRIIISTYW